MNGAAWALHAMCESAVIRLAVVGGSLHAPLSVWMHLDEYSEGLAFRRFV